jgi:hypothetical protein
LVPTHEAVPGKPPALGNGWTWIHKEDGAGFEEMGDQDNDEKSGYTNALRRAAQDAWGIGRYLYDKGLPGFLDPNAMALERVEPVVVKPAQEQAQPIVTTEQAMVIAKTAAAGAILDHKRSEGGDVDLIPSDRDMQKYREMKKLQPVTMTRKELQQSLGIPATTPNVNLGRLAESATAPKKDEPTPKAAPINLPRSGRSTFAWVKLMESTFGEKLMPSMIANAKELGWPTVVVEWTEAQTRTVTLGAVAHIMKLPSYKGQFDHLASEIKAAQEAPKPAPAPTAGINVADIRKDLVNRMKALISKQTGRDSTDEELKGMFLEIAPQCKDGHGHTGEVPESLNHLGDVVWLRNMIAFVDDQLAFTMSNQVAPEADDTPF